MKFVMTIKQGVSIDKLEEVVKKSKRKIVEMNKTVGKVVVEVDNDDFSDLSEFDILIDKVIEDEIEL